MIKIGKFIRINPLTILLFAICHILGQNTLLCISYATIFAHEMAHLLAAKRLGLNIDTVSFQPFGVNLKLKNKIVFDISDEIILYLSGPMLNIALALAINLIKGENAILNYFYTCNTVMFFINIMPVMPLDGGVVIKKLISRYRGYKAAEKILKITSSTIILTLLLSEVYLMYTSNFNISVIIMIVFLTGNIFTSNEKYNIDFVEELMFVNDKPIINGKLIVANSRLDNIDIAKNFVKGRYGVVVKIDDEGRVVNICGERDIISSILKNC